MEEQEEEFEAMQPRRKRARVDYNENRTMRRLFDEDRHEDEIEDSGN